MNFRLKGFILTIGASVILVSACYRAAVRPVPSPELAPLMSDDIVGLITTDGTVVEIQRRAQTLEWGDTAVDVVDEEQQVCTRSGDPFRPRCRFVQGERTSYLYSSLAGVQVREIDPGKTVGAVILGPVVAFGLLAVVVAASSCPVVYVHDGTKYRRAAEPLGGATTRGLQRVDLSRLEHAVAEEGVYRILIQNEMDETQYLGAFQLVVVDHPAGTRVLQDRTGVLHVFRDEVAPTRAVVSEGADVTELVRANDDAAYTFDMTRTLDSPELALRDTMTLEFPRPDDATEGALVLGAHTTPWGAHMVRQMLELWGSEVDTWYDMLDQSLATRLAQEEWALREEHLVLKVWIQERDGWRAQEIAVGNGPVVPEDQIVPLDLSRVDGDVVRLRFEPPRGFWAIDFATMTYSLSEPVSVREIEASTAVDHNGADVRQTLASVESGYLEMPEVGDRVELTFEAPDLASGSERTLFARSEGYYRIHTDTSGERQNALLDSLWLEPDFGAALGMRHFPEWLARHQLGVIERR